MTGILLSAILATGLAATEVALELPPTPDNPRNSEGPFVRLKDGSLLFAWSRFRQTGAKRDDGGVTWGAFAPMDDLLLAYCMKRVRKLDTTRMRRVSGNVIDGLRRKE